MCKIRYHFTEDSLQLGFKFVVLKFLTLLTVHIIKTFAF